MPVVFVILLTPSVIALAAAILCGGWKRVLAWAGLALTVLPLLAGGVGGAVLRANGLAWRSGVKLPLGMLFVFGVLVILILGSVLLWERTARLRLVWRALCECAIAAGTVLVCLAVGWYGLLFAAIWAGTDRVVTADGQSMVAENGWEGWDYYAYHGPLVRGTEMLEGSDYLKQRAKREEMYRQDAAARETAAKALGLDIPSGVVDVYTDTHGGFHNDGITCIKIRFSDTRLLWDQVRDNPAWSSFPGPAELSALADLVPDDGGGSLFPVLSAMGDMDRYFFRDRFIGAEDVSDPAAALERGAYNFTLAVYDSSEQTLYFCKLDT